MGAALIYVGLQTTPKVYEVCVCEGGGGGSPLPVLRLEAALPYWDLRDAPNFSCPRYCIAHQNGHTLADCVATRASISRASHCTRHCTPAPLSAFACTDYF